ncbi:unnamed protein product [Dicrocoelium dendriticum]|nr:unnamed protein product [Dicrocoelium dendriticum]
MIRLVQQCYPSYSVSAASTLPIQPRGGLIPNYTVNAWKFQTSSQTGAIAFDGPLGNYAGSGYVQDLSRSREVSELMLEELFRGRWIDMATRALFLDFAIYNANINMYMIVK